METVDPSLVTTLVALCAAALMAHAGVAKRRLEWRPRRAQRPRKRRKQ
jgi:peptidoglycan/LPS O-acetylase OafA/YrhL